MGSKFQDEALEFCKINKIMNINFLKSKKSYKKQDYQIDPEMYWKVILYIALIIVTVFVVYDFSVFTEVNNDPAVSSVNINDQIEKNRKKRIESFLEYFSQREKKSDDISNSPSPVVDPSI